MNAQQERAESFSAAFRLGPTADHELLLVSRLDLHPIAAASISLVRRLAALLADDALEIFLSRALVKRMPRPDDMLRVQD